MRAWTYTEYGSPEVLRLSEIDTPVPGPGELLIRVHAASVNGSDWESLSGRPLYTRLSGLLRPKHHILGSDIAGTVEAVGPDVESFRAGDEVFGDILYHGLGGFADYVCLPARAPLLPKPPHMGFEEAAALPQAAVIAVQGLGPEIGPGSRVLINGAGGGAGTFAVQLALSMGAAVTAVDNGHKLELLRSLGADPVIDYKTQDPTKIGLRHDLVLDLAAHRSALAYGAVLNPGGRYSVVGGSVAVLFQAGLVGVVPRPGGRRYSVLAVQAGKDPLRRVLELVDTGMMSPVIDETYDLTDLPEALLRVGEGRALGKVIVKVSG